jgi:predicted aldo/keto reductase-like oxidoreductase
MIYREMAGERVSRLGLGGMRLPVRGLLRSIDRAEADAMVDDALAAGLNYFDTAYFYHLGRSEGYLGSALGRRPRESYHIATKYYLPGFPDYEKVFRTQLERLGVEYVDFYLLHSLRDSYFRRYFERGSLDYLLGRQQAGQIRHLGFSSHMSPANLELVASMRAWDFAQIQLNYYDWCFGTAREQYEVLCRHNIPIVVMEPVRGGKLARLPREAEAMLREAHPDWSPATWALRWVKRLPQVKVVLSGMSDRAQMDENLATFADERALADEETEVLYRSCGVVREHMAAPCTACGYCLEACPKGIAIPRMMDAYNELRATGRLGDVGDVAPAAGFDACVGCGACAKRCPQSIPIPTVMAELKAAAAAEGISWGPHGQGDGR